MINLLSFCAFLAILGCAEPHQSAHAFDDSILYDIKWPGSEGSQLLELKEDAKTMIVTTHEQETYKCILPAIKETKKDSDVNYDGPNPIKLLAPLFLQSPCTPLFESYWTYELCHGKHLRQYHEEREGKKLKTQEYILGKWDKTMTDKMSFEFDKEYNESGIKFNPPTKKIDSIALPYIQFNYTDGTNCDLNGKPRKTSVLYICSPGKPDIISLKETSTCEYEAIAVAPQLCKHPKFRPQVNVEHDINCLPVGDSPRKPRSLLEMEEEIFKQSHFPSFDGTNNEKTFVVFYIDENKDKDIRITRTQEPVQDLPSGLDASDGVVGPDDFRGRLTPMPFDDPEIDAGASIVIDGDDSKETDLTKFLKGKLCINGGVGYWKYHFCYGAPIEQFHSSKKGAGRDKASVILGRWDEETHKNWLKEKPSKRPKPIEKRTYITHFYGSGDICAHTGKPRETEVRLQCPPRKDKNYPPMVIYHLEPKVCEYILVFESPLICQLLPKVDQDGLVDVETLLK